MGKIESYPKKKTFIMLKFLNHGFNLNDDGTMEASTSLSLTLKWELYC